MGPTAGKRRRKLPLLPSDPYQSARIAGLRYVTDSIPGIRRVGSGNGFHYRAPDGSPVRDRETLARIRGLVIPPAWTDVWICPTAQGHLQAVGFDQRGRKQYRYHPLYRAVRDATKYSRMIAFGKALPGIRARVEQDLKLEGIPRNKVLAAVVRLLEQTCVRVGNEEYRKQNESFGLTTLRNRHVAVQGSKLRFRFKGKSGQMHDIQLADRRLARIVHECQCLPGHELFQYLDGEGEPCPISSEDVNGYLREITGDEFTAKDFRTWNGTCETALVLEEMGPAANQTELKKNLVEAVKRASVRLGNRPATCRKYYVHPAIVDSYSDGSLFDVMQRAKATEGLDREEVAVMDLLARYEPDVVRAVA